MLGYYVQQTYFSPKQRQYQLDFGDAQWIEPPEVAPIAYFRKEVFLSVPPAQAWLEVAATDEYDVIVNNRSVGNGSGLKTRVAGIYDIKRHWQGNLIDIGRALESQFPQAHCSRL
ncbi:MAG: hypothetical protein DMG85_15510 [Acidobacteria bacterium]|nr:MAG: hypothetical protein DMG85_15510 [Acidobacteriota bacterium]